MNGEQSNLLPGVLASLTDGRAMFDLPAFPHFFVQTSGKKAGQRLAVFVPSLLSVAVVSNVATAQETLGARLDAYFAPLPRTGRPSGDLASPPGGPTTRLT